jgi:hypothetical protein
MLTDLLVAGLMVAAAPDLLHPGAAKASPLAEPSAARAVPALCPGEARARYQIALLEAHAAYAAMAPFSFARTGPGSAPPATHGRMEKDAAEREADRCKS